MKTRLEHSTKHSVWLRFGLVSLVLLGVITFLLVTNMEPVEAAPEVTLHSRDLLLVTGEGCNLVLVKSTQLRARMGCDAFTPTATNTPTETATEEPTATATTTATEEPTATATATEIVFFDAAGDRNSPFKFTSDVVAAPDAKIRRTIKPGKKLVALATVGECKLKVVAATGSLIKIKCKPLPATATPTRTATHIITPTRTNTPRPAFSNLYLRNSTGGELCYEVFDTGIGRKCFGGGDSFYGTFVSGTHTYKGEARCGSLTDSIYYPPGNLLQEWKCVAGIPSQLSQIAPDSGSGDSLAAPSQ